MTAKKKSYVSKPPGDDWARFSVIELAMVDLEEKKQIIEQEMAQLENKLEHLSDRLSSLRAQREKIKKRLESKGFDKFRTGVNVPDLKTVSDETQYRGVIGDQILLVLWTAGPRGLTTAELHDELERRFDQKFKLPSIRTSLTRLRREGILDHNEKRWSALISD